MLMTIKKDVQPEKLDKLIAKIKSFGLEIYTLGGTDYSLYGILGDTTVVDINSIQANEIVESVVRIAAPYKKANRLFHPEDTIVDVCGIKIGGKENIAVIAGPCSVEGYDQVMDIAKHVKDSGAVMLRGGAYKPRTSPYAFQGMGKEGLDIMNAAKKEYGLPVVSELMSADKLDEFVENVDIIQIGARNMQNFDLLKAIGKVDKPILLKRGFSNTIEEWLMSAEYIMAGGNEKVILCERGIRTFEKYTRNTLDLSVVPVIKQKSHLPIVIDPSHATGDYKLVEAVSLAAIAAGADGLIIEVHNEPEKAWSDGPQSLKFDNFDALMQKGKKIAEVIGRKI